MTSRLSLVARVFAFSAFLHFRYKKQSNAWVVFIDRKRKSPHYQLNSFFGIAL